MDNMSYERVGKIIGCLLNFFVDVSKTSDDYYVFRTDANIDNDLLLEINKLCEETDACIFNIFSEKEYLYVCIKIN